MNVPETCDLCGCEPTVDPVTDVIDLTQTCGITTGIQLDREHWLCSDCRQEFGGCNDGEPTMTYRNENLNKQHLDLEGWTDGQTVRGWVYSPGAANGDHVDDHYFIEETDGVHSPRYLVTIGNYGGGSDDLAELEQLLAEYIVEQGEQIPADMNYCPKVHAINDARIKRDYMLHMLDKHNDYGTDADWDNYGDLLLKAFGVDLHDEEAHYEGFYKWGLNATEPEIVEFAWTYCVRLAAARDNDMRVVRFEMDGIDHPMMGMTDGTTWNGWANIWMTEEDYKAFDSAALKAWGDEWRLDFQGEDLNEIPYDKDRGLYSLAYGYCCEIVRDEDVRQDGEKRVDDEDISDPEHCPDNPMCNCETCFNKRADGTDELTMLRSLAYKFSLLYSATVCVAGREVDMGIDPYGEAWGAAEKLVSGTNLSEAQQNYLLEL